MKTNVVVGDFTRGKPIRLESMAEPAPGQHWVGGIADQGFVTISLDVTRLSPDATRIFARTLLTLADTAEAQAREER